jgi:hypothetical protein
VISAPPPCSACPCNHNGCACGGDPTSDCIGTVDITIKEKDHDVVDNGLVVKVNDTVEIALAPNWFGKDSEFQSQISWQTCQLKSNGFFTDWADLGSGGTRILYTPQAGGIFQLKAIISTTGQAPQDDLYTRKSDEQNATDSLGNYNDVYRAGQPDYFGVVDTDVQIRVRWEARRNLGNTAYAESASLLLYKGGPTLISGKDKCNAFVFHKASDGGALVPLIDGHITKRWPPSAYDWWDAGRQDITNWNRLADDAYPQPGYVVAGPDSRANGTDKRWGHAGILDYDGAWINAGRYAVNKYPHLTTNLYKPYQPLGMRKFSGN